MEQKQQEQLEEQHRIEWEDEEEEQVLQRQEEELSLETQRVVEKGHQEKVNSAGPQQTGHSHWKPGFVNVRPRLDRFRFTADPEWPGHETNSAVG